jgi:winged helix-turn-helix DNA-binding protein
MNGHNELQLPTSADVWAWLPSNERGLIVPAATMPAATPGAGTVDGERLRKPVAWHRNAALLVPLLLVNTAAVYGQQGWAYDHLGHDRVIAVLFATAVESIGVYLAAEAHAALMAGDASARLRLGSYLVGLLVGTLNYAHFASAGYAPNPIALTFGLLSSISPLLWSIRSRSLNRDRLRDLGQVDPRAVRFSLLRWALFPIRTSAAFRAAVWAGIVQPSEAVAVGDAARFSRKAHRIVRKAERAAKPKPEPGRSDLTPETRQALADLDPEIRHTMTDLEPADHARPGAQLTPRSRAPRRDSNATKVAKAAARNPGASPAALAAKLNLSDATVRRYLKSDQVRPGTSADPLPSTGLVVNGHSFEAAQV